jgi:hypothetical protein
MAFPTPQEQIQQAFNMGGNNIPGSSKFIKDYDHTTGTGESRDHNTHHVSGATQTPQQITTTTPTKTNLQIIRETAHSTWGDIITIFGGKTEEQKNVESASKDLNSYGGQVTEYNKKQSDLLNSGDFLKLPFTSTPNTSSVKNYQSTVSDYQNLLNAGIKSGKVEGNAKSGYTVKDQWTFDELTSAQQRVSSAYSSISYTTTMTPSIISFNPSSPRKIQELNTEGNFLNMTGSNLSLNYQTAVQAQQTQHSQSIFTKINEVGAIGSPQVTNVLNNRLATQFFVGQSPSNSFVAKGYEFVKQEPLLVGGAVVVGIATAGLSNVAAGAGGMFNIGFKAVTYTLGGASAVMTGASLITAPNAEARTTILAQTGVLVGAGLVGGLAYAGGKYAVQNYENIKFNIADKYFSPTKQIQGDFQIIDDRTGLLVTQGQKIVLGQKYDIYSSSGYLMEGNKVLLNGMGIVNEVSGGTSRTGFYSIKSLGTGLGKGTMKGYSPGVNLDVYTTSIKSWTQPYEMITMTSKGGFSTVDLSTQQAIYKQFIVGSGKTGIPGVTAFRGTELKTISTNILTDNSYVITDGSIKLGGIGYSQTYGLNFKLPGSFGKASSYQPINIQPGNFPKFSGSGSGTTTGFGTGTASITLTTQQTMNIQNTMKGSLMQTAKQTSSFAPPVQKFSIQTPLLLTSQSLQTKEIFKGGLVDQVSLLKTTPMFKPSLGTATLTAQITKQAFKTNFIQTQQVVQTQTTDIKPVNFLNLNFSIPNLVPPTIGVFKFPGTKGGFDVGISSRQYKGGKKKTGYTPSFTPFALKAFSGITLTGKYKKTSLSKSGLDFRPFLSKLNKRRKKK